jgi:quercetin dioxygenase-like cupin family protein
MKKALALATLSLTLAAQTGGNLVMAAPESAEWQHERFDPPGAESVLLRDDPATGGTEMLVRYPGGHKFEPHWHTANERMVVIEGTMRVEVDGVEKVLGPGSYAYLPARKTQNEQCVSETRCGFYVFWDGKLDFHR